MDPRSLTRPEGAPPPMAPPKSSVFDEIEYRARLDRTKAAMSARGLETLVVSDPANIFYLSGYDAWSFYVGQALVVTLEHDAPSWIGREMDLHGARITSWLDDDDLHTYDDDLVQSGERHWTAALVELLAGLGATGGRVGVETDASFFTARTMAELSSAAGTTTFVDADLLVNWVRIEKSPAELELMRQAAAIVERAMRAAFDAIAVGVRGSDAAAAVYQAQISGSPEWGGSSTSSPPFMPAGVRSGAPHLTWTDDRYESGDIVPIELVACRLRYHTPLARTVHVGPPPTWYRDAVARAIDALDRTLQAIRPGCTAEQVEATWQSAVDGSGLVKRSRLGYSIGIAYPPTFGERTVSFRPGDATELRPGMTLHLMPGIWIDGWGIVITESFELTDDGVRTFCSMPRDLVVR